jgi:multidrug resistance protein
VGFGIVLPILPLYAKRLFHTSPFTATALVAAFSAAQLLFSPLWGRVSDRVGRRPVLLLSLAGTAVGSLITGLAGAVWVLFLGRVVDGVSGASVSVAQAAVADVAPPEQRARLLGLLGAAFGIGFVAGPAIGALAARGGPRVPFVVAAALAGGNALVALRRLPETHPVPEGGRPPLVQRVDWRAGGLAALVGVTFTALAAFSAFEATFALFGERRLGFRIASTGATFTAVGLLLVLVQVRLLGPTVRRLGEGGTVRAGLLLNAAGLVLLMRVHSVPLLVPALAALVVGQGLAGPTLSSMVAGRVGAERRGGVLGVQQAAGGLARVVGPLAGGALFQRVGAAAPYGVGAALMVLAVAARIGAGAPQERHVTVE